MWKHGETKNYLAEQLDLEIHQILDSWNPFIKLVYYVCIIEKKHKSHITTIPTKNFSLVEWFKFSLNVNIIKHLNKIVIRRSLINHLDHCIIPAAVELIPRISCFVVRILQLQF